MKHQRKRSIKRSRTRHAVEEGTEDYDAIALGQPADLK